MNDKWHKDPTKMKRTRIGRLWFFWVLTFLPGTLAVAQIPYRLHAGTESDLVFQSVTSGSRVGMTVAPAGDVNGDGFQDVVVGDPGAGAAYIFLGRLQKPAVLNLEPNTPGLIIIRSDLPGPEFGWAVSKAGDFNGDTVDDVIIGWPRGEGSTLESGAAAVLYGNRNWPNDAPAVVISLSTAIGVQGFLLQGIKTGDRLGAAVAGGGDFNDDNLSDIVVAAPGSQAGTVVGKFYVVYGMTDPPALLPVEPLLGLGFEVHASAFGGMFPETSSTICAWPGDVDGDTIDDLLLGTPLYGPNPFPETGAAWLIPGSLQAPPPAFSVDDIGTSVAGARLTVDPAIGEFSHIGYSVAGIGDLNKDGLADFAIGAPGEKNLGTGGTVAVVLGSRTLPATVDLYNEPNVVRIVDDVGGPGSRFGRAVAGAGDPNNDGVPDIVIGAPRLPVGATGIWPAGHAFVIYGREAPEDVFLSAAFGQMVHIRGVFGSRTPGERGDLFGWSVCGPGDLDGDGVDDVAVGAPFVRTRFDETLSQGMVFSFYFEPPRLLAVFGDDPDGNLQADPNETLHLMMSIPVHVEPGPVEDLIFTANSGQVGFNGIMDQRRPGSRRARILLGADAIDLIIPGSVSAIDFSETGVRNRIISRRLGVNAIDSGVTRLNDTAVDIQNRLSLTSGNVSAAIGGSVAAATSPDAVYEGHSIEFAPRALGADARVVLAPAPDPPGDLGLNTAVLVSVSESFSEALVTIHFRDEDLPPRAHKRQMRVVQIVERRPNVYSIEIVPGVHTVNVLENTVSARISALSPPVAPQKAQGGMGLYAGLPIDTVDEDRQGMNPRKENARLVLAKAGLAAGPGKTATVSLTPGPMGFYTKHELVFYDYETSTPGSITVTIRTATLAERTYTHPVIGSQYFPDKSDAVFTIETEDSSTLSPVAFASPVDMTIEYKPVNNPQGYSDIMDFNENPGVAAKMRIVRSVQNQITYVPDFEFIGGSQNVNETASVVKVKSYTNLTDSQGKATYGLVVDPSVSHAKSWPLYR